MQEENWIEYGAPGTPTLTSDEIERAIKRLERLWDDAASWAHPHTGSSSCCDACDCHAS